MKWELWKSSFLIVVYLNHVICSNHIEIDQHQQIFHRFIEKYHKSYANGSVEYAKRLAYFSKNVENARTLNRDRKDNVTAWYGITKFSDLSTEEFKDQFLSGHVSSHFAYFAQYESHKELPLNKQKQNRLPDRKDWRENGVVTPVKNQQGCGGCWAFSVVEVIESVSATQTGRLEVLSAQEVIDCSRSYRGVLSGCQGGQPCAALDWLNQTRTILVSDAKYPLKNKNQMCKIVRNSSGVLVKDFKCAKFTGRESEMLRYLAEVGPLSVTVDATSWSNYQGGIIQYHCPDRLNHAVTIVGYDLTGPVPYYIVRNSWGIDWGIDGYLHLRYNVNICGVASQVSWVKNIDVL